MPISLSRKFSPCPVPQKLSRLFRAPVWCHDFTSGSRLDHGRRFRFSLDHGGIVMSANQDNCDVRVY
jgi:hypothetical protein